MEPFVSLVLVYSFYKYNQRFYLTAFGQSKAASQQQDNIPGHLLLSHLPGEQRRGGASRDLRLWLDQTNNLNPEHKLPLCPIHMLCICATCVGAPPEAEVSRRLGGKNKQQNSNKQGNGRICDEPADTERAQCRIYFHPLSIKQQTRCCHFQRPQVVRED